jgi:hypothetical protein
MQGVAAFMLAANARRLSPGDDAGARERRDTRMFWGLAALGIVLVIVFESFERSLFALEMTVAGVMEIVIVAKARGHLHRAHRWLAWSWATFVAAYACWWADLHGVVCDSTAHLWNGHAAWHVLMAGSLYCVQRFHVELTRVGPQGKKERGRSRSGSHDDVLALVSR